MNSTRLEFMVEDAVRLDIDRLINKASLSLYKKSGSGEWHLYGGVLLTPDQLKRLISILKDFHKELTKKG